MQSYLVSSQRAQRAYHDTGIPACMDQLTTTLLLDNDRTLTASLGTCMEFVLGEDVPGQLVSLCMSDRPAGIRPGMLEVLRRLVQGMSTVFLVQQNVLRAMVQLMHDGIRLEQRGDTDAATDAGLLDWAAAWTARMVAHPPLLRLFLALSPITTAEGVTDAVPLFSHLVRHLACGEDRGFSVRTAVRSLLGAMLVHTTDSPPYALAYLVECQWAEWLSAEITASFSQPTVLDAHTHGGGTSVRARRWQGKAKQLGAYLGSDTCTWMDLLWLAEEVTQLYAQHARTAQGREADLVDQLRFDLVHQLRISFFEGALAPSVAGCQVEDASAASVLFQCGLLLHVLDPRNALAQVVCARTNDERTLETVITECMLLSGTTPLRRLALRLVALYTPCLAVHDGMCVPMQGTDEGATFAAMAQSMQSPRHVLLLTDRYLCHAIEAEHQMRVEQKGRRCVRAPSGRTWAAVAQDEFFLPPLLSLLSRFFALPLSVNMEVVNAITALCRSPCVAVEGVFVGHDAAPPVLTFALYCLVTQSHAFVDRIPDVSFYLTQRKQQQLWKGRNAFGTLPTDPDQLVCPFAGGSVTAYFSALEALGKQHDWPAPTHEAVSAAQLELRPTLAPPTVKSVSGASHGAMNAALDGARHLSLQVYPCPLPGQVPAAPDATKVPLLQVLDNVLLLEELLLDLATLLRLRTTWAV